VRLSGYVGAGVGLAFDGGAARGNGIGFVVFWFFGVAVLALGHLHLLLRLVSSELHYPFLSFPLNFSNPLHFKLFQVFRVMRLIHLDLIRIVFMRFFSYHRFRLLHCQKYPFWLNFRLIFFVD
jgi:hypothetical protein